MPNEVSNSTLRAWSRLRRAQRLIEARIERGFKAAGLPNLAGFEVLEALSQAPERRLRPSELEQSLEIAQYSLSRLLDRIEQGKLAARSPCVEDGRGQWVTLTEAGDAARTAMREIYVNALNMHVEEKLSGDNLRKLGKLLGKLLPD